MVSKDQTFHDVRFSTRLKVADLTTTPRTPSRDFDGVHLWVRYRSDKELYAISLDRRDGKNVIKKKCPGGTDNGGTYFDLTPLSGDDPIPLGEWQQLSVTVRDQTDGSVLIDAERDGKHLRARDFGVGCPALNGAGGVGVRGDNTEFNLDGISVVEVDG
ncbi:hypothetical protein [Gordonia sp. CPCC 205515]|uniref:hypothetical protein n=1 Tax=Gordonia sp. CPCC 205515 TaxID=3140791 RepID=UPI003AF3486D